MTGPATKTTERLAAGVVGVGAMGDNHARVYSELPSVSLAGVCDVDRGRAETVAESYGTSAHTRSDLLSRCDLVSVAVPTAQHVEVVADCLEAGVHVLVEKPLAQSLEKGRSLAKQASDSGLVLQVGHVERFNPAVETLAEYLDGLDVVAVDAQRLGPPVERTDTNGVTIDLMIHDVDVITSLLEATPGTISGAVTRDRRYATASLEFDSGVIATLTASRLTKRKVRRLAVTARECYIEVDYLDQSVTVHRDSYPEYISDDGRSRFRYESVIERPRVPTEEPLRRELAAFISAVKRGEPPVVSAEDGLDALAIVRRIDETAGIVGDTVTAALVDTDAAALETTPISVWGLGKLGLPVAAVFADQFGSVTGVDVDPSVVETVSRGDCPMNHEPGLASLIDRMVSADRLEATTDGLAAATAARVYVIVVPTLLTESKAPDLSMVQSALETIAKGLDQGDLVLIESTLPPGTTQSMVRPLLARESTLELDDLRVAYCPERTSSGTALRDIRGQYPRIVGGVDQPSAEAAARVYEALSSNSVTVVSNATTAEYVKLFEGIYRDVNIALANEFVRVVESTTVSVREAIEAANALPMCDIHDPGPGVGGHCIPVYPYFLEGTVEGDAPLTATARAVNEAMPSYTVAWIDRILSSEGLPLRKSTVAVMGLTYRANIPETRWSPGIDIVVELERLGATTYGVDPLVDPTSVACPVEDLEYLREHGADAVIVTSPHEVFQTLDWSTLDPLVILDGRDALDLESDRHRVYTLGGSQSDIEPTGQSPSRPSGGK